MKKVYYLFLVICLFNAPALKAQVSGDYRSNGSVTVSLTSVSNWQTYNGSSWVTASSAPNSTVTSGNTITILSAATWNNNSAATIPVGVTLLLQGTAGTFTANTLTINGTYIHESSSAGSTVFTAINATTGLGSSSTVDYRATSTLTVGAPKFSGYTFNNLTFDVDPNTPPASAPSITPGIGAAVTINGKLTVSSWTLNFNGSAYAINLNGGATIVGTSTLAGQLEVIAATIASGDTLNVSNNYATLAIAASSTVTINGVFVNSNTGTAVTYNSGSALVINGTYDYNINGGTLSTSANLTYSSGCTIAFTGVTNTMPTFPTSFATGANVLWNCTGQTAALNFTFTSPTTINGNFTVQSTGTKYIYLGGGGTSRTLTVTGNMIVNGGQFDVINPSGSGTTVSQTCNVTGNVTVSSGALYAADATNGATGYSSVYGYLNISGSLNHTGGNFGSSTYTTVAGTGVVTFNTTTAGNTISSIGLTGGNADSTVINTSSATITLNSALSFQKLTLTSGSLALANGVNLTLSSTYLSRTSGVIVANGTNDSITLAAAVTIPASTFSSATVTNLVVTNASPTLSQAITVSGSLTLNNTSSTSYTFTTGGNLTLGSGATYTYNKSTTSALVGLSLSVAPNYAGTANFIYMGTQNLTIGTEITSASTSVINTLTINNSGVVSLNSSITIQNLVLTQGQLNLGSSVNLFINGSIVSRTSGTLTANGTSVVITLGGSATIPASTFSPTTVTALVVNNSATAKLNQSITVPSLTLTSGSLTLGTGVNLTLSSSLTVTSGVIVANGTNDSITLTAGITIPGATFSPATITNLVVSNAAPTLSQAITVSSSLTLINTSSSSYSFTIGSNLTIGNGATYTYNKSTTSVSFGLSLSAQPTYAGTANFIYLGTMALTMGNEAPSTSSVINNLTINNAAGVSLNQSLNATVNGTLTLTSGNLLLGSSNLTLASGATIATPSASSYIQTSGTGSLIANAVGAGTVIMPLGTASYYLPLSLSGTTNTPNITTKVLNSLTHAPANANNVVTVQWSIQSSTASTSNVTFQYNTANQGSGYTSTGAVLGTYVSSYTESALGSVSGSNPYMVTKSSLSLPTSSASLYVIGDQYQIAATVPGAPTIGTATAGNQQASVTFTAPSVSGTSAITGYTVTSSPGGITGTGSTSPITVTGLTNGTAYTFTVTAANTQGTSAASSASNSVTPVTVPGVPTSVTAVDGNSQATITFTAPSSNGGSAITSYTVTSSPGSFTNNGSTSPITVNGLSNGTAYTFTVTATNSAGTGAASAASNPVTPSATTTWSGTAWSAGIPTAVSTAIVAGNITNAQWGGAASVVKLTINSGATFANTGSISITGTPFTDNGTISGGIITLNGSAAQTISGNGLVNNITINNGNGVTVTSGSNNLGITGILTLQSGTFTTNGNVTLKSTSITNTGILAAVPSSGAAISGNVTVERYIPQGYRAYRDLAPEVYNTGNTMFNSWEENGRLPSSSGYQAGYGIFVTGESAINTDSSKYDHRNNASADAISGQIAANSNGLDYSINGIASAYTYNNATGKWNWNYGGTGATSPSGTGASATAYGITNTTTTMLDPFQGYRVLVRGDRSFNLAQTPIVLYPAGLRMVDATTVRATGSLVTGNVAYSTTGVTNAATGTDNSVVLSSSNNGFSEVANPYASPVDWNVLYTPSTTTAASTYPLQATFYYFDPTFSATGDYVGYNKFTGSVYNHGGAEAGYIQPGQAVFVVNNSSLSSCTPSLPTLTFTESSKAASSSNLAKVFGATTPLSKIYLSILSGNAGAYTLTDGAAVAFESDFGNTVFGPQDVLKIGGNGDNLFISDKGKSLAIDGRLPATASDAIALNISKPSTTGYQLKVDASNYINEGFAPLLFDAYRNTTTAITGIDSVAFTVDTSIKASYENRFTILFAPGALAVNSIVASATLSNNVATITWNTVGEKGESYYEVEKSTDAISFSSIGQQTAKNTTTASYSATDKSVSTGNTYYRIKAVSQVGTVGYSNVAKLSITNYELGITLYPNPMKGKVLNLSMDNVAAGKYVVSIYNLLGEKVNEQTISHAGGSGSHALVINSALAGGIYSVAIREEASKQLVYQTSLVIDN